MLEQIMSLINGPVKKAIDAQPGIPEDKKSEAIQTTASSLMNGLKQYATSDNLSALTSLLGGGSHPASAGLSSGLESSVVSALTSKVGLSPQIAQTIASTVIPAVMSLFSKKVNDDNEPGFNVGSLLGALTGKGQTAGSGGGGVMDMLGNLLGKKG